MAKVEEIYHATFANMAALTDGMKVCLTHNDERCYNQKIALTYYDGSHLEIEIPDFVDPHSLLGKLFKAVADGNGERANAAIKDGGPGLLTQCDPEGLSPFHRAVKQGHSRLITLFLAKDPSPSTANSLAKLPTQDHLCCLAAEGGTLRHCQCIDSLCDKGALIDTATALGQTPLHIAVLSGKIETVRKIISKKSETKAVKDVQGRTMLHLAASVGAVDVIEYLVSQGLDLEAQDYELMTPLHYAAQEGHLAATKSLLRLGANPFAQDRGKRMPLRVAVQHIDVIELLLPYFNDTRGKR